MNQTMNFEAIGTPWQIDYQAEATTVEPAIVECIESFDKTYSRFRDDSLVHAISEKAGKYDFPADAEALFAFYRQLYEATTGKVTPLIGNLLLETGYDADYSLRPSKTVHTVPAWEDAMSYSQLRLTTKQPVTLDFGAAGKGYLIDIVAEVMKLHGISEYLIDGSGDLLRHATGKIRVGLQHPEDEGLAIGVVQLGTGSLCASAGNRRTWGDYHHIMDPDTKQSTRDVIATWALADTAMVADGLATALFFTPAAELQNFTFEYCLMRVDGIVESSPHFPAEIFNEVPA